MSIRTADSKWALPALVVLGLTWRCTRYGLGFPLWGDEGMLAVNLLEPPLTGFAGPLAYSQVAPVGWLWSERLTLLGLGATEWSLRLLPWLAGIAALLLFCPVARQRLEPRPALLATAILAVSYYPVRHAAECKPYAVDLLAAVALLAVVGARPSARRVVLLGVLGAGLVWVSFPAVFVAGGLLLASLPRSRREAAPWLTAAVLLVASFALLYLTAIGGQSARSAHLASTAMWRGGFPPMAEPFRLVGWFIRVHSGRMLAYPIGGANGGSTATLILVVLGIVSLWRGGSEPRRLLAQLLAPAALGFAAAALGRYPYGASARTMLYLGPAACLLAGVGLATLLARARDPRRAMAVASLVLGAIAVVGIGRDLIHPRKTEADAAVRDAIEALARRSAPGDRWLILNAAEIDTGGGLRSSARGLRGGRTIGNFHAYLLLDAPCPVVFEPERFADHGGRVWLLHHVDGRFPLDPATIERVYDRAAGALGPAVHEQLPLDGEQWIDVHRFDQ